MNSRFAKGGTKMKQQSVEIKLSDKELNDMGLCRSIDGNIYDIDHIPENAEFENLYLSGSYINRLPKNLKVRGILDLSQTKVCEIPDNLFVGGWLILGSGFKSFPKNFDAGKINSVSLCDSCIKSLPVNLRINGTLDLGYAGIKELPMGLKAGKIYISKCKTLLYISSDINSAMIADMPYDRVESMKKAYCGIDEYTKSLTTIKSLQVITLLEKVCER